MKRRCVAKITHVLALPTFRQMSASTALHYRAAPPRSWLTSTRDDAPSPLSLEVVEIQAHAEIFESLGTAAATTNASFAGVPIVTGTLLGADGRSVHAWPVGPPKAAPAAAEVQQQQQQQQPPLEVETAAPLPPAPRRRARIPGFAACVRGACAALAAPWRGGDEALRGQWWTHLRPATAHRVAPRTSR